ncbi:hypothetical protein [Treponema endosymbiont of Eucomonympha sp.]|uniref:hypothetical protein n=1 Tax=Treponema endosymbiont of Eucomonympha sp. TaxID=1580831 RepID=UPI000784E659|nr:hypothetical protein [Treponema endosymbiont of Eucomonympha sp.]
MHGDCDGYNSEPGGKTTIYEYFQSEINKSEQRLKAAGVKPEVYRTSKTGKHCWVRFDTDLLNGVGWEGRGINPENDDMDILANGTLFHFKELKTLRYAETLAVSLIVTLSERLPKPRKNGTRRQLSSYSQMGRRKPRTL